MALAYSLGFFGIFLQFLLLNSNSCEPLGIIHTNGAIARAKAHAVLNSARAKANLIKAKALLNQHSILGSPNPSTQSRLQKRHDFPGAIDEARTSWDYNSESDNNQFPLNYWPMNSWDGGNTDIMRTNLDVKPPIDEENLVEDNMEIRRHFQMNPPFGHFLQPTGRNNQSINELSTSNKSETRNDEELVLEQNNLQNNFSASIFNESMIGVGQVNRLEDSNPVQEFSPDLKSAETERHGHTHVHTHHVHTHQKDFSKIHSHLIPSTHVIVPNVNVHINQHQATVVTPSISHQTSWNKQHAISSSVSPPHQSLHQPSHHQPTHFSEASSFATSHSHSGTKYLRESNNEAVPQFFIEPTIPSDTVGEYFENTDENMGRLGSNLDFEQAKFDPFNQREKVMDFLARHRSRSRDIEQELSSDGMVRSADPHKHKHGKFPQLPGRYREAEDEWFGDNNDNWARNLEFEENVFIPSLLLTQLEDDFGNNSEMRTADPHKHKHSGKYSKYPQVPGRYREAEGQEVDDADIIRLEPEEQAFIPFQLEDNTSNNFDDAEVGLPYLFDIPRRRFKDNVRYERSPLNTENNNKATDEAINNILQDDLIMLSHIDGLLKGVDGNNKKQISKRSISLIRLINDPAIKMDIPKTIDNFGTVTRNAFEDEKAPLYHLKNLIGSSKNTVLSAMRIPPQHLIIPSNYEIIKSANDVEMSQNNNENVGDINPSLIPKNLARNSIQDDPLGFYQTFQRVGEVLRDSVKSSQDTAVHIGDIAHDAKNMLHTARHSAPRLVVPYIRTPAIQKAVLPPKNVMLVTPKLIDLTENRLQKRPAVFNPNFVKLGHILDAVGISKPNSPKVDLEKIVLQSRGGRNFDIIRQPLVAKMAPHERIAKLFNRMNENDLETVGDTLNNLEEAKISVGAKSLQDFLIKMRNEFLSLIGHNVNAPRAKKPDLPKINKKIAKVDSNEANNKKNGKNKIDSELNKEIDNFVENLLVNDEEAKKNKKINLKIKELTPSKSLKITEKATNPEKVGVGLILPQELYKPFMGQPTKSALRKYLRENGDIVDDDKILGQSPTPTVVLDEAILKQFLEYMEHKNVNGAAKEDVIGEAEGQLGENSNAPTRPLAPNLHKSGVDRSKIIPTTTNTSDIVSSNIQQFLKYLEIQKANQGREDAIGTAEGQLGENSNAPTRPLAPNLHKSGVDRSKIIPTSTNSSDVVTGISQEHEQHLKQFLDQVKANETERNQKEADLGYVLSAINPIMFERMYNQTLKINEGSQDNSQEIFKRPFTASAADGKFHDGTVGASALVDGSMLKPFMGEMTSENVEKIMDNDYNQDVDNWDEFQNNLFESDY